MYIYVKTNYTHEKWKIKFKRNAEVIERVIHSLYIHFRRNAHSFYIYIVH